MKNKAKYRKLNMKKKRRKKLLRKIELNQSIQIRVGREKKIRRDHWKEVVL